MSQPSGQPCQRMKGKAISQLTNPDKLQNLTLSQTPRPIELAKATCHQMEWKVTSRIRQALLPSSNGFFSVSSTQNLASKLFYRRRGATDSALDF